MRTPAHEVLVVFVDLEVRDIVTSYARNLAGRTAPDGSPTAGLRLDVPVHLMGIFRLLENHGKALRDRYGPDFRRPIRFDDSARSLFLNNLLGQESVRALRDPLLRKELSLIHI